MLIWSAGTHAFSHELEARFLFRLVLALTADLDLPVLLVLLLLAHLALAGLHCRHALALLRPGLPVRLGFLARYSTATRWEWARRRLERRKPRVSSVVAGHEVR